MASLDKPNFGCCLIDFSFSFVSDVLMSLEQMATIQVVFDIIAASSPQFTDVPI